VRESSKPQSQSPADALRIGDAYYNGTGGVTQDYAKAMVYYRKAADAGNAEAMGRIGFLYEQGQGVAQDYQQTHAWYLKQDYQQEMDWYLKEAATGNAWAMYEIGVLYDNGQGVAQDQGQAVSWYRKAAAPPSATKMPKCV